jgi:predicted DsbA family dithiol-disulfide isomerase
MARIEVFADIVCPVTYVGLRRLSEARSTEHRPVALRVRAWPLEWINGAPISAELAAREIDGLRRSVAPELFAGFDPETFPSTSIAAFGLAAAAYSLDDAVGEAVSLAVRRALFEDGLDVGNFDVLRAIGKQYGVEPLTPVDAQCAVRSDWERGKVREVKGSPHFFVGDRDWFCPSLEVIHDGERFEARLAEDSMRDFYAVVLT